MHYDLQVIGLGLRVSYEQQNSLALAVRLLFLHKPVRGVTTNFEKAFTRRHY